MSMWINNELFKVDKKSYPHESSVEYKPFWKEQRKRCMNGYTVGGKYMTPELYWYINFWKIDIDEEINGQIYKVTGSPFLRDIDWELFTFLDQAAKEGKGLVYITARGAGKTYSIGAWMFHGYTFYPQFEGVVSAGRQQDITNFMKKMNTGAVEIPEVFKHNRVTNLIEKEIRSGVKDKKTNEVHGYNSRILTRNFEEGNKSSALIGLRPKKWVIEEAGHCQNLLKCFADSEPAIISSGSSRRLGVPVFIGTGGDMERSKDLQKIFYNPEAYGFLAFEDVWEKKGKVGYFVPAYMCKNDFKDDQGRTDIPKAMTYTQEIREQEQKKDSVSFLKHVMYYPNVPSEAFMNTGTNIFNTKKVADSLATIRTVKKYSNLVKRGFLHWTDPKTKTSVRWEEDKDGKILIVSHPEDNPPMNLYVAGLDPYRQEQADTSPSLGSLFIFKTMSNAEEQSYYPVCEFTDRPEFIDDFHDDVLKVLTYYNARVLYENEVVGFMQYARNQGKLHLLLSTPKHLIQEILPNSKVDRKFGIHMTPQIKYNLLQRIKEYIERNCGRQEDGSPGNILFEGLLEEMLNYNDTDNFDRIISFGLCLFHDFELGKRLMNESKNNTNIFKLGIWTSDKNGNIKYQHRDLMDSYQEAESQFVNRQFNMKSPQQLQEEEERDIKEKKQKDPSLWHKPFSI